MGYSYTSKLILPLEKYRVGGFRFGEDCTYGKVHWGIHLGEDVNVPAGTEVKCVGKGRVVYSAVHPGTKEKGNWGNIVIVAHKNPKTKKVFFSLYAHMSSYNVAVGENVELGQVLGKVGKTNTPENGWWEDEHLHFAIYVGAWKKKVLSGYWKKGDTRTSLDLWREPMKFIEEYAVMLTRINK